MTAANQEEHVPQVKTKEVELPPQLFAHFAAQSEPFKSIKKAIPEISLDFQPDTSSVVISSAFAHSLANAEKLMQEFLASAASLMPLLDRLDDAKRTTKPEEYHVEEFAVPYDLMSLAIGTRGAKINAARQVEGVIGVMNKECDDKNIQLFKIIAHNEESAKAARDMVEYVCESVSVPRAFVGRVIGKSGSNIQKIIDATNAMRVNIDSDDLSSPSVTFHFTGNGSSVRMAKAMVEFCVQLTSEVEKVRNELSSLNILSRYSNSMENLLQAKSDSSSSVEIDSEGEQQAAKDAKPAQKDEKQQKKGKPSSEKQPKKSKEKPDGEKKTKKGKPDAAKNDPREKSGDGEKQETDAPK